MSEIHKILCDGCGSDLRLGSYPFSWRMKLTAEMGHVPVLNPSDEAVALFGGGPLHFCGLACLKVWVEKQP